MNPLNYTKLQEKVSNLIVNTLDGIACTITALDNSMLSTYVCFNQALVKDIDNRQNPTVLAGYQQLAYVPGTIAWMPDVGGQLTYKLKQGVTLVTYVKRIAQVTQVGPGLVPLLYALVLE